MSAPAPNQIQPMGQPQQQVALSASHLQSVDPYDPARHAIIYNAKLAPAAKFLHCLGGVSAQGPLGCIACLTCSPICNILQWEKLNARSYVRVYENRLESNHASTCCFGALVIDGIYAAYLDKSPDSVMTASSCTPLHLCCCIECAGGVVAMAPMGFLNNCLFTCCRTFIGGVDQPQALLNAILQTRTVMKQGARLPAGAMLTAPVQIQMQ